MSWNTSVLTHSVASIAGTDITISRQYTIRLRNYGISFSQTIRLIMLVVKYLGKSMLKTMGDL